MVLSADCFPVPKRVCTPETHDGTALSRIGPICMHIRSKCSGVMCLLAATWQGEQGHSRIATAHYTKHVNDHTNRVYCQNRSQNMTLQFQTPD